MMTSTLSLNDAIMSPLIHLNSTKEFFMLASPILKELSASRISSTAKSLWKVILDLSKMTPSLTCSYARSTLGKMINRSVRTVTTLVAELEEHGFLHVTRGYASRTLKKVNVYQVTVPQDFIEKAMTSPNRKRKTQSNQRSDAMDRLSHIQKDLAYAAHGLSGTHQELPYDDLPTHEEHSLREKGGSEENCTINKKEDLNKNNSNNNNSTGNTDSISVPVSILSEINSTAKNQNPGILAICNQIDSDCKGTQCNVDKEIKKILEKIGESRHELEHSKKHQSYNAEKITTLTIKERILCKERDDMLDFKRLIDEIVTNSPFVYTIAIIVDKYKEYQSFYNELTRISSSKLSSFENGNNESEYANVEQAETICWIMLDEIKIEISRQQINAKLAFFLKDPCFVGHDLRVHDPKIPKNLLKRYFDLVKEVVKDDKAYEIFNEMAASVRFGELSKCKDEEGKLSFTKGFNVALKLLREGRWTTPKCVSVVVEMIKYSEINLNVKGVSLFKDVNCQLQDMGLSR